ncbi:MULTISPECIES: S8 family peptidase [Priestia]|uniref:Peptidase S8 n=1 Tax=Priestia veravalensis TaxID=1414648 RepID=A0A0V8JPN2_9BACI|nr:MULTISPECIES: S8 family peptidase [Priestia]KSU89015.1 peptidase S8 [Priestia veravalensis]SCB98954.1 Subtilase family protein [Priestia flexa]
MSKIPRSLMVTVSILILLFIGLLFLVPNTRNNENHRNKTVAVKNNPPTTSVQNVENEKNVLQINSLSMGQTIKNQLRNDPSVFLIKHNEKTESHYIKKEVNVTFKTLLPTEELERMAQEINGNIIKNLNTTIVFRSNKLSTKELIEYFNRQAIVEFAEPNYLYLQNQIGLPNDLLYKEQYQWNLSAIQAEAGWDITKGDEHIIIAVINTGVDLDHPDLRRRLTNGYNVLLNNNFPDDDNGHGTHVSGIIASETNNHEGLAGVTWYNKIMPIKAMGAKGYGTTFDIAKGIFWAVDHGADIINMSLGNYQHSSLLKEAIDYAYNKNVVLIAAAGNENTMQPSYPAAFPNVLSVAAVSYTGQRAFFSNYGDYIDVSAPGVQIPSTYFNQQYAALSGTSMASPHVAGLAGLLLSANPNLTNQEVIEIIKNSTYDLGIPGTDNEFGNGLINVKNGLEAAQSKRQ